MAFDGHSLITKDSMQAHADAVGSGAPAGSEAVRRTLFAALDEAALALGEGNAEAIVPLLPALRVAREGLGERAWRAALPEVQGHRATPILREDPFTGRCAQKPRGYAGDAGMLDFIYGHPSAGPAIAAATDLGRGIFSFTNVSAAASAVRERRRKLARLVDAKTRERGDGIEILTVAAGYLRETELSEAYRAGALGRWVALDQDAVSLAGIAEATAGSCVVPFDGSVGSLLAGRDDLGNFDLAYAAGLYDYLTEAVAVRLTRKCLSMLRPGGTFMFANFTDETADAGYMESVMDWMLVLRTGDDMLRVAERSMGLGDTVALEYGENGTILYATITKGDRE